MRDMKQQKNNTILNPWWMSVALLITTTATAPTYGNVVNMTETVAERDYLMDGKAHYLPGKLCIIDAIAGLGHAEGFCVGNIIKYVTRYRHKGGVEDLKKAKWYIDYMIENCENKEH